jgi:hypothetical protein
VQVSAAPEQVLHEDEHDSQTPEALLKKDPSAHLQIPPVNVIFGSAQARQVFAFVLHDLHEGSHGAHADT